MTTNIKERYSKKYLDLLSEALYVINKWAKVARDYNIIHRFSDGLETGNNDKIYSTMLDVIYANCCRETDVEYYRESYKSLKYYYKYRNITSDDTPLSDVIFLKKYYKNIIGSAKELFAFNKGTEYFYNKKDRVLEKLLELDLLKIEGYHSFGCNDILLVSFGTHSFHTKNLMSLYEMYCLNIPCLGRCEMISSKCISSMELAEAIFIIDDFLNNSNIDVNKKFKEYRLCS